MRSIGWYLLSLVSLSALSLPAHALLIEFCVPDCASGDRYAVQSAPEQTSTDSSGMTTTTVPIASFVHHGFTIEATVSSQQSGTAQKITFNPTTITANPDAGCTGTTSNPCLIQIVATSDPCDFPTMKPAGGYPAGAFMMGAFFGSQPTGNGDTIAMTGESSGLTPAVGQCSDPATRPPAADPV